MAAGSSGAADVCLPPSDGGYGVVVGGGGWPYEGQTALELAETEGYAEVVALLRG